MKYLGNIMETLLRIVVITILVWVVAVISTESNADGAVLSNVRVIHASSGPPGIDPRLRDLAPELKSVFRYTTYRLINEQTMNLRHQETGRVLLPGERILELTPAGVVDGRIRFRISILKNRNRVFGTEILLKNGSSLTIGGPAFENGFLLFNISGQLR